LLLSCRLSLPLLCTSSLIVFVPIPLLPTPSPPFPYTPLFRSHRGWPALRRLLRLRPGLAHRARRLSARLSRRGRRLQKGVERDGDRKSTRLNSSHQIISYAVFCLKKTRKRRQ